ncbi:MAG TPA: hypothetical protein ENH11_04705 [Candidatus Acetothermia bacterium]|nr:hypothetical protein [Candidatus Acetothermia bacterium]
MLKAAFKIGYLTRLAEFGLSPDETESMLKLSGVVGGEKVAGLLGDIGGAGTSLLLAGLALPVAAGALTGWGHASLFGGGSGEADRMQKGQLTNTVRDQSRKLMREIERLKRKKLIMQEKEEEVTSL